MTASARRATRRSPGTPHAAVVTFAAVVALSLTGFAHVEYTVEPGDTLDGVARRHGTSVSVLMRENDLADPDRIVVGTTLSIPEDGSPDSSGATGTHHVVRRGENLSVIAQRYGLSVERLAAWNGLSDADTVPAGARISVDGPAAPNVATTGGGRHRVAAGETLSTIAGRAGVSVGELAAANGIADPDRIVAGATLTIPGGWHCPVRGPVLFVNDFGITKPSGRFHDGIDLFAARGTPVVAPVAGRVDQATGERAGLQFRLHGVDGHVYIGTHLDSLDAAGQVQAGQVIGTVGTTGNARNTTPHLHFEIHAGGDRLANPHPSLRTACS